MSEAVFLTRVVLNNYRSIKGCSVTLGPLTFLVGQNGAGKSNFLDALRLVTESLNTSLEHALRDRGGVNEVRRRSSGHPTHFGIRLEWQLKQVQRGFYAFRVGARTKGEFEIQKEECYIEDFENSGTHQYTVENGEVKYCSIKVAPPAASDRLYLVAAAGLAPFRPLYDALTHMGFYNLNPDAIRDLQSPDPGEVLKRDGSNLASVLSMMTKENSEIHQRVVSFLSHVAPGITGVDLLQVGKKETLEFKQRVGTNKDPWRFTAENMSDGTLRALGVLTALFQTANGGRRKVPFVGIEEPEAALHPGAAGILRDGLQSAAERTQVAVTSHSPDLLDDKGVNDTNILAVENINGETRIGQIDDAGRQSIRDCLYTPGELLRLNQINPDKSLLDYVTPKQLELFYRYEA